MPHKSAVGWLRWREGDIRQLPGRDVTESAQTGIIVVCLASSK